MREKTIPSRVAGKRTIGLCQMRVREILAPPAGQTGRRTEDDEVAQRPTEDAFEQGEKQIGVLRRITARQIFVP